jgi:two-component system, LytTR family, sensor kinase
MSASPFRSFKFMLPFCSIWFVWICVHQLALYYMGIGWFTALTDSIVSNTLLLFVALLIFTIFRFYLPAKNGLMNLIAWLILLTLLWFLAGKWLLAYLLKADADYMSLLSQSWPVRTAVAFLINGCTVLTAYVYFNWQEKTETEKQKAEIQNISKEAELYKLRSQLQPHFLFNSLNSINALIGSSPAEARKMVHQLSEFLRTTLKKEEQQWVKLQEEMHSLQLYLDIEKVRFGNRLSAQTEIDAAAANAAIPAMILQPLVENAIKFGLYDTTEAAQISVKAFMEGNELMVEVCNPYDSETALPKTGTGFGLSSVQRRLFLLFGRNDLLQTFAKENIFSATVQIPQRPLMNKPEAL